MPRLDTEGKASKVFLVLKIIIIIIHWTLGKSSKVNFIQDYCNRGESTFIAEYNRHGEMDSQGAGRGRRGIITQEELGWVSGRGAREG